jgi:hypothetical protein
MNKRVSIIAPIYNERENPESFVAAAACVLHGAIQEIGFLCIFPNRCTNMRILNCFQNNLPSSPTRW